MAVATNPFVDYLSRYTTASPDHEAAFDEFLAQNPPPSGVPLRLETRVESFLRACFNQPSPPSVILTGNAGDGKTYLCRQVVADFTGQPVENWDELAERPVERGGVRLHVVKDLSELGEEQGAGVLRGLAATLDDPVSPERYLIAANEGRLRHLLASAPELVQFQRSVEQQLRDGPALDSEQLIVLNLTEVATSAFVPTALRWMTDQTHWQACEGCPLIDGCPVHWNALRLRDEQVVARVKLLYRLLEHLDIHVTVRDMLIHLAYAVTGNKRCPEIQQLERRHEDRSPFVYYENIWGREDDSAFSRKASVVQHLALLRVGDHSLFEVDDFIVSGGESPAQRAEHERLFAAAVDLNQRRFAQDREAYLSGGADRTAEQEEQAMMRWLRHCRRKLFFEWRQGQQVIRLIPFLYLEQYLTLLHDGSRNEAKSLRGMRDEVLRELIQGLNRGFSRLYLTESDYLYVTTQYLHSGEQPRPLVRLRFPITDIWLELRDRGGRAYDCDDPALELVVAPPAQLRGVGGEHLEPVRWRIGLLSFEYLLRLAHGGTYNILAEECELGVRAFKDRLLSAFAGATESGDQLAFFVAERHRYSLKRIRVDEHGNIRG